MFMETSGTERSSVITKRSSISDRRCSTESKLQFERPPFSEHGPSRNDRLSTSVESEGDHDDDDVMDMLAMYEYDEEEVDLALGKQGELIGDAVEYAARIWSSFEVRDWGLFSEVV